MVVRIRLARFGRRHNPIYNIVVAQARTARNSKPLEVLGVYDPIPKPSNVNDGRRVKNIDIDVERTQYWIGVGAQPSDPVRRLLALLGIMEPKYRIGDHQKALGLPVGSRAQEATSIGTSSTAE